MEESSKKKYFRRNRLNIITTIILCIILILGYRCEFITIVYTFNSGDHFNILTINSILAGFVFTELGIISSAIDRPRIDRLNNGGYLDDYFNGMYICIISHIISMVSSTFIIIHILEKFKFQLLFLEELGLLVGIAFFIKSVFRLFKIIKKIRTK